MKQLTLKVLLLAAICVSGAMAVFPKQAKSQDANLALNKNAAVDPAPNSQDTPDNNPQYLTDGIYASTKSVWNTEHQTSSLWVQKGCVGWVRKKPVVITIDLEKDEPISGLIYSTAGGKAGVGWPDHIYIATSADNKMWHYAGDLVKLSEQQPPKEGYANFRYISHDLKTHGRYVAIAIMQEIFVFTDEIEVLRGDDALLNHSAGPEIFEPKTFVAHETNTAAVRRQQLANIDAIRALIKKATLTMAQKSTFEARLDKDKTATEEMPQLPIDFKAIIPLTDIHRDILAVHGEALAAQGFAPLTVWQKHRYAWLPFIHAPEKSTFAPALKISMLRDQFRLDAFLLTNASGKPMTVKIKLQDPPRGAQNGWLQLSSAIWTDTFQGIPVQDALMPMEQKDGVYSLEIPAGITGKIWATVDSSKLPAGSYKSTFAVNGAGQNSTIPLNIDVAKLAMPKPRLSTQMWEDTNGNGSYALTPKNREAAIQLMRSHFVDPASAGPSALPLPRAGDFDAKNQLIGKLDFSNFDQWVAMWPGTRNYFVFRNVEGQDTFAGTQMGTPEFDARVGNWARAIVAHLQTLSIKPSQLIINFVDEARSDKDDEYLLKWGKPFKAAAPEIRLYTDPIWHDPQNAQSLEAVTMNDIICPHPNWANGYYENIAHQHGRDLWLYNGPGLGRVGDPQLGYRQMAWRVFAVGGTGQGFWSFSDTGGVTTSWYEYALQGTKSYTPAFIDEETVYNSVHWDAVRDGVEDFEELSMLKDAVTKSSNAALKAQAQKVLDDAVATVTALASEGSVDEDNGIFNWDKNIDPTVVDMQSIKVRAILEKLNGIISP